MNKIFNFFKKAISFMKATILFFFLIFCVFFLVNNREHVAINFKPLPIDIVETRVFVLMIAAYVLGIISAIMIISTKFLKVKLRRFNKKN